MTEHARVYGGSLYDLAAEEQLTEAIKNDMQEIKQIFCDNPDYIRLLSEPSIKKDERTDLIEKAFGDGAQRYLVNFLKILCEKGLLGEVGGCFDEFTRRYNADHNIAVATVTSAIELSDQQKAALKDKLKATSGKDIELVTKVDPTVVAGIKVELEGKQLDGTVAGRLDSISKKLSEIKL